MYGQHKHMTDVVSRTNVSSLFMFLYPMFAYPVPDFPSGAATNEKHLLVFQGFPRFIFIII